MTDTKIEENEILHAYKETIIAAIRGYPVRMVSDNLETSHPYTNDDGKILQPPYYVAELATTFNDVPADVFIHVHPDGEYSVIYGENRRFTGHAFSMHLKGDKSSPLQFDNDLKMRLYNTKAKLKEEGKIRKRFEIKEPHTEQVKTESSRDNGVCPICGGAGFLRREVPVDHPDFGRAFPCECKIRETQQASLDDLRKNSGLAALSQMTFETFRPDGIGLNAIKRKNLREAFEAARRFTQETAHWLLLKGRYGSGKTHLAAAIANDRIGRGESVFFVVVPDLLDHLRATFAPTSRITYDERFESVRNAPFLILDDLGAQSATPWAQEKLFQLINHRYNEQLPTVITTNRELEEIEPSIRSRLSDSRLCTIVTIVAPDFRQGGVDAHGSGVSNLALYSEMTFESFDQRGNELKGDLRDNLRRVFHQAQVFANRPQGMMVFTGDYGSGKTHLAAAIANALTQQGHSVLFVVVPDLLDHLRAAFAPGSSTSFDHRFEEARNAPYLVLDDFGTENATPWAREKLFQIIDYRYVAQLPTVITIAREGTEIEPRVQTRIFDLKYSSINEILAPSFRQTHRRAQAKADSPSRKRQSYR